MRLVARILLLLISVLPSATFGQPGNSYRLVSNGQAFDRFVGDNHVGTIRSNETALYTETPSHTRVLAVEYSTYDNRVSPLLGLELPEEQLNVGATTDGLYRIKLAGSVLRSAMPPGMREDFWAFGLYPSRETNFSRFAFGLERNSDKTIHTDLTTWSTTHDTTLTIMTGASWEQYESHGTRSEPHRLGTAIEYRMRGPRLLLAGGVTALRHGSPAWTGAFAHYVKLGERGKTISGPNPGLFGLVRMKPESTYGMFMVTLFQDPTVNEYVVDGITSAFFRGSFSTDRVVGSREFNTPVVGHGYDDVDMALLVFTGTIFDIDVTPTATMRILEYEGAATLPRALGRFCDPYVDMKYDTATDLTFNRRTFRLDDPRHHWWSAGIGSRIRILSGLDPRGRHRLGYLRIETGVQTEHGVAGGYLKGSFSL